MFTPKSDVNLQTFKTRKQFAERHKNLNNQNKLLDSL